MNKSQLIDTLAGRFEGNRKQAAHALESVLDTITREVAKGEKVAITGFGSFEKRVRDARWVRNPRTGERIKAKKTAIPKFSAGADLKAVVSGAKKLPKLTLAAAAAGAKAATGTAKKASGQEGGAGQEGDRPRRRPAKKAPAKKAHRPRRPRPRRHRPRRRRRRRPPAKKAPAKKTTGQEGHRPRRPPRRRPRPRRHRRRRPPRSPDAPDARRAVPIGAGPSSCPARVRTA